MWCSGNVRLLENRTAPGQRVRQRILASSGPLSPRGRGLGRGGVGVEPTLIRGRSLKSRLDPGRLIVPPPPLPNPLPRGERGPEARSARQKRPDRGWCRNSLAHPGSARLRNRSGPAGFRAARPSLPISLTEPSGASLGSGIERLGLIGTQRLRLHLPDLIGRWRDVRGGRSHARTLLSAAAGDEDRGGEDGEDLERTHHNS